MNYRILIVLVLVIVTISCTDSKKEKDIGIKTDQKSELLNDVDGLVLLQQKCYICHSVTAKSHEEIIAPPLVAIKRRYQMMYTEKEDFVKGVVKWVMDPKEENALMRGAVAQFNVMPKQPFEKDEIIKIAEYISENELERPEWFENHFNEEHPNGMGSGQGKGSGRGRGNGKGRGMRNN